MQALNEYDSNFTPDDMESFFKTVSREDLNILMIRIDAYQETPDMIYFLQNWNKLPSEEEASHIHIKYQMCSLMMELIEPEEKEIYSTKYCLIVSKKLLNKALFRPKNFLVSC